MKSKFLTIILIMFFLILLCLMPNCFALEGEDFIPFEDPNFKNIFINGDFQSYDQNGDEEISVNEMAQVTSLSLSFCPTDYSPLQYATSFQDLSIIDAEISNLSELSDILATLPDFCKLYLYNNNLTDVSSLNKITNLNSLSIYLSEQLKDISCLKDLTNLENFVVRYSSIEDASVVSSFINLKYLSLENNKLKSIPDLSKITEFNNVDNQFCSVNFNGNEITDISGLKNTAFFSLGLTQNKISDLTPLSTMPNLKMLNLSGNEVTDISKLPTTILSLTLSDNDISDISYLKNLSELNTLELSNNKITDASSLSGLESVTYIGLNNNNINNLELKNLPNLSSISCANSNLKTVTLENLPSLSYLTLNNNNISDISNLTGVSISHTLNLSTNPISDISPISNTNAKHIYLIDTLVNPYDEATFHIMCTWQENGQNLYLGDCSQFKPSDDTYTTEETEEVTIGEGKDAQTVTVMPVIKETDIENFLTVENFPIMESCKVEIYDANGNLKETGKLGSRNVIKITDENGNVLEEYTVIVPGDITGNGESRMYDAFQILKDTIIPGKTLDAIDIKIRDYNDDGNVRMYDAFQFLKEAILG